mgnify:CR=1 FL=1
MEIIEGGVTAAKGFKAAGMAAGIKYKNGKKDMAMVFSEKPCVTAGTFTLNRVFAAPVKWDKSIVYSEEGAHAIVVNSGVANACTGTEGDEACALEAKTAGEVLGVPAKSVLLGSTGVIGMQLPMDRMCAGIKALPELLDSTKEAGTLAAEAIMTTDTRNKQVACTVEIGGKTVTVGGMCKGAGMIHPHMATMLCFITSDAVIDKRALQKMTSDIVEDSFNMISVDGDTSTNDTVLVLANGEAGNEKITEGCKDYDTFYEALSYVLTELSKMIAGEYDSNQAYKAFNDQLKDEKSASDDVVLKVQNTYSNYFHADGGNEAYSVMANTLRGIYGTDVLIAAGNSFTGNVLQADYTKKMAGSMIMPNSLSSYKCEITGAKLKEILKAFVEGCEGGFIPFNRGSLPVVSGISMEVKENGNGYTLTSIKKDGKTIKDDDTFTVMCLAIKKHMEPFLSLEGDLFEGGDTLVKDTWINYVLGDDAVLAKPEPYITLR